MSRPHNINSIFDQHEPSSQGSHGIMMPALDFKAILATLKQKLILYVQSIPFLTLVVLSLSVAIYLIDISIYLAFHLFNLDFDKSWLTFILDNLSLDPKKVIHNFQVWRLFTYTFAHVGFFHLLFNILATIPLSYDLEFNTSTINYFFLTFLVFLPIPSLVYCALSAFPSYLTANLPPIVGLSGLFFTLIVWKSKQHKFFNLFGACTVPAHLYPAILFLIISFLFPAASFLGHLLGLALGYLYTINQKRIQLSDETLRKLEDFSLFLWLSRTMPSRFIKLDDRTQELDEGQVFPSREPTPFTPPSSGSGYHVPQFQSASAPNPPPNYGASPSPASPHLTKPFSGQGNRLGD